jgi:hypothetical protein
VDHGGGGVSHRLSSDLALHARGKGANSAGPSTATLLRISRPKLDQPKDDGAVTLAGLPHRPHAINHSRLDLDKAPTTVALHGPSR